MLAKALGAETSNILDGTGVEMGVLTAMARVVVGGTEELVTFVGRLTPAVHGTTPNPVTSVATEEGSSGLVEGPSADTTGVAVVGGNGFGMVTVPALGVLSKARLVASSCAVTAPLPVAGIPSPAVVITGSDVDDSCFVASVVSNDAGTRLVPRKVTGTAGTVCSPDGAVAS